jgi:hypothetical protein
MCSLISCGPVAQLSPITSTSGKASIAVTAAAMSVPISIVPVVSMVTWHISGTRRPVASKACRAAWMAILVCRMSWQVSISRTSAPPSISPRICSV